MKALKRSVEFVKSNKAITFKNNKGKKTCQLNEN